MDLGLSDRTLHRDCVINEICEQGSINARARNFSPLAPTTFIRTVAKSTPAHLTSGEVLVEFTNAGVGFESTTFEQVTGDSILDSVSMWCKLLGDGAGLFSMCSKEWCFCLHVKLLYLEVQLRM